MPEPKGIEKREWKRIDVNMPARCRAVDGPACYDNVLILDMHQNGCCLQGREFYQKGQVVRVVLEIPFEGSVNMAGEVAWSGPLDEGGVFRVGLRFLIDNPMAENMCMKLYNFCLFRQSK
jgi:hypothetical protein